MWVLSGEGQVLKKQGERSPRGRTNDAAVSHPIQPNPSPTTDKTTASASNDRLTTHLEAGREREGGEGGHADDAEHHHRIGPPVLGARVPAARGRPDVRGEVEPPAATHGSLWRIGGGGQEANKQRSISCMQQCRPKPVRCCERPQQPNHPSRPIDSIQK